METSATSNADLCAAGGSVQVGNLTLLIAPLSRVQLYTLSRYVKERARERWFPEKQLPAILEHVPPADKGTFIIEWLRTNKNPPFWVSQEVCGEAPAVAYLVWLLARELNPDVKLEDIVVTDPDRTLIELQDACGMDFITGALKLDPTPVPTDPPQKT